MSYVAAMTEKRFPDHRFGQLKLHYQYNFVRLHADEKRGHRVRLF